MLKCGTNVILVVQTADAAPQIGLKALHSDGKTVGLHLFGRKAVDAALHGDFTIVGQRKKPAHGGKQVAQSGRRKFRGGAAAKIDSFNCRALRGLLRGNSFQVFFQRGHIGHARRFGILAAKKSAISALTFTVGKMHIQNRTLGAWRRKNLAHTR